MKIQTDILILNTMTPNRVVEKSEAFLGLKTLEKKLVTLGFTESEIEYFTFEGEIEYGKKILTIGSMSLTAFFDF